MRGGARSRIIEPDDGMIECAIAALQRVMERDTEEHIEPMQREQPPMVV